MPLPPKDTVHGIGSLVPARREQATSLAPSLLEFHSPTLALAEEPAVGAARGVTWVTCSMVTACVIAAALIPIDKVVTAPGHIVSLAPTRVIQPLETAIVRSVDVKEGQAVHKGDVLARLDPTFAEADAGALRAQVASLGAEVDRLSAEADGTPYRIDTSSPGSVLQGSILAQRTAERTFKVENYNQKIASLVAQRRRAETDMSAYVERLKVAQEIEDKRAELERLKVGSQLNLLSARDSRLETKRGLDSAMSQAAQANRDLQAMEAERDAYGQTWRGQVSQELTEQGRKLSDAREQLGKATLRRHLVELRADADAVVLSVSKVSVGSVMQSGEQLMSLVPSDAELEAEVNVPGTESGFVHPGNKVTIKFDTLPFAQYGYASGKVRTVSPDSFTSEPEDRSRGTRQDSGQRPATAFYKGKVTILEDKLHDTPPGFRVIPGMPVTADIKVGERTLVSYLMGRVLPVVMDGMREP